MSDANASNGGSSDQRDQAGVLANLPRTRPQRSSARRAAARTANGLADPPGPRTATRPGPTAAPRESSGAAPRGSSGAAPRESSGAARKRATAPKQATTSRKRPAAIHVAPRQGFESEGDTATGPVRPPGGAELVASVAEIIGEVAKAGVATGERLLKDVVSWLPR